MRADRLLSLALLLQARGAATARALAAELGVSVRTVYRDLEALSAAGVPVVTEAGPGGGCRLMDGYRFPLRGLRPDEAEALLILGVPAVLHDLGLAGALTAAHRQIRVTAGLTAAALVHLDMPRWFGGQEEVPCLRDLARALRLGRKLAIRYPPADREPRVVGPLGLVNKAGIWYLVARSEAGAGDSGCSGPGACPPPGSWRSPSNGRPGSSWPRSGPAGRRSSRRAGRGSRSGWPPRRTRCPRSVRSSARRPRPRWRRRHHRARTAGGW